MTVHDIASTPRTATHEAIIAALALVGTEEPAIKVPQGEIGGCLACRHTVLSHFTIDGDRVKFVGCPEGTGETVFVLAPVRREGKALNGKAADTEGAGITPVTHLQPHRKRRRQRKFYRARYFTLLHPNASPAKLELSEARAKVLTTIHEAGKVGLRTAEIIAKSKLPNKSIQSTLSWLRSHKHVSVAEDEAEQATT